MRRPVATSAPGFADRVRAGRRQSMSETPERDPANPTPEELEETAAAEGLMATEEETDPDYEEAED